MDLPWISILSKVQPRRLRICSKNEGMNFADRFEETYP